MAIEGSRMKNLRTIILAAGKGTRMKSATPKVLHPVCGVPMIQYVLDIAKAAGSLITYVVVGHQADAIRDYVGKKHVCVEQKKQLGTGDAVKAVQSRLRNFSGDVLIMCGDTPLLRPQTIKDLIKKHRQSRAVCTLLTVFVLDPRGYGRIIRDNNGQVVAIREEKDAVGLERNISEISIGVYCVKARELNRVLKEIKLNSKKKEYYLTDMIALLAEQGLKVASLETEDAKEGLGINSRCDLAVAEDGIRHRILKDLMLGGVTIVDPSTTYVARQVKIGQDTVIKPFTTIETDVQVGKNCVIGPFARLRSGTRIGDKVEVGNFTEISRSKVGSHSFMKHFSFLGDAIVGKKVNIGAGVITANFDGVDKHVTRIEDQAFIGSDSVLVAPVKIGKKAVIGAGSVVPKKKNIPAGAVAKGIPAQITVRRKRS